MTVWMLARPFNSWLSVDGGLVSDGRLFDVTLGAGAASPADTFTLNGGDFGLSLIAPSTVT